MLIEHVERQVEYGVTCRRNPKRAARKRKARVVEDALRRRNQERDQEQSKGPVAGLMNSLGDRARTELAGCRLVRDPDGRSYCAGKGRDLDWRPAPRLFAKKWHDRILFPTDWITSSGITSN